MSPMSARSWGWLSRSLTASAPLTCWCSTPPGRSPRQLGQVAWAGHLAQLEFFVKSPVLLGRALIPALQARRYGRIVQVDSEVADRSRRGARQVA
jgi:NAD(P)-dependent dehydrogenase (short-subunit alcohol dehydrogenase family)